MGNGGASALKPEAGHAKPDSTGRHPADGNVAPASLPPRPLGVWLPQQWAPVQEEPVPPPTPPPAPPRGGSSTAKTVPELDVAE
ncbi:unnamed protein product, partial [Polarella glacialis]